MNLIEKDNLLDKFFSGFVWFLNKVYPYRGVFFFLTGVWAVGVGLRMIVELVSTGRIVIVGYLWFDWVPMFVFGVFSLMFVFKRFYNYLRGSGI